MHITHTPTHTVQGEVIVCKAWAHSPTALLYLWAPVSVHVMMELVTVREPLRFSRAEKLWQEAWPGEVLVTRFCHPTTIFSTQSCDNYLLTLFPGTLVGSLCLALSSSLSTCLLIGGSGNPVFSSASPLETTWCFPMGSFFFYLELSCHMYSSSTLFTFIFYHFAFTLLALSLHCIFQMCTTLHKAKDAV